MDFLADITYTPTLSPSRLPQRRHNDLERLDQVWQSYLALGAKYFLNIPHILLLDQYNDMLASHIIDLLQDHYDIEYSDSALDALGICAHCRVLVEIVEALLSKSKNRCARKTLWLLERELSFLTTIVEEIEYAYETVIAAANALMATGRLAAEDPYIEMRMSGFKEWVKLVEQLAKSEPKDFVEYAYELGWEDID